VAESSAEQARTRAGGGIVSALGASELHVRIENPALFAAADDLAEAEMARRAGATPAAPNWLTPREVEARVPHLTVERLAQLRHRRQGPPYYRPTLRAVFYLDTDIDVLAVDIPREGCREPLPPQDGWGEAA
jgi:hypothetical protein